MRTALVIMAAGIGSRFGGGIKQLEPVGPGGEIIMEYSIHDAIEAGFNKIVFIIRRDIEQDFREVIGRRIEPICAAHELEVVYAYQTLSAVPAGVTLPVERSKPWGTGQAVLSAKSLLHEPFAVINADDYYGKTAYKRVHDFLVQGGDAYCMAGFVLKNTLSDNGGVTRGICKVENGFLTDIVETHDIVKTETGAMAKGEALSLDALVSMNMWGLTPAFLNKLEKGFAEFFDRDVPKNPLKAEFLIPSFIGECLAKAEIKVSVLRSDDNWYGMTYREDLASVKASFQKLYAAGVYGEELFADL